MLRTNIAFPASLAKRLSAAKIGKKIGKKLGKKSQMAKNVYGGEYIYVGEYVYEGGGG